MHKDYSRTPLARKLGISEGSRVLLVDAPAGFSLDLPSVAELLVRAQKALDVIVLFATEARVIERRFAKLPSSLHPAGRLWVKWPKKASKVPTDVTFELVQGIGLAAGLVDNKSASIDDAFRGLQFVYRLRDRPHGGARSSSSAEPSGRLNTGRPSSNASRKPPRSWTIR